MHLEGRLVEGKLISMLAFLAQIKLPLNNLPILPRWKSTC